MGWQRGGEVCHYEGITTESMTVGWVSTAACYKVSGTLSSLCSSVGACCASL